MTNQPLSTASPRRFYDTTLSELPSTILVLDRDGVILAASRQDPGLADNSSGPTAVGVNYVDACEADQGPDADMRHKFAAGIREVLAGRSDKFEMVSPGPSPDGGSRFVGQAVRIPGKGRPRAVVSRSDITALKQDGAKPQVNRSQLQVILDTVSSGIISINDQQEIVYFNRFAEEIFGYRREEVLGKTLAVLLPERFQSLHDDLLRQFGSAEEMWQPAASRGTNLIGRRKNGEEFPIEVSISKLNLGNGLSFTAVVNDNTLREQFEAAEREQRALAEAISNAALTLNSTLNLHEVLERILALVEQVVAEDGSSIMLVEGRTARIMCMHGEHLKRGYQDQLLARDLPLDSFADLKGLLATRQPVIFEDTQTDSRWVHLEGTEWIRSCISVPIRLGDQPIGFLNIDSKTPGAFSQREARWLEIFAAHAAIAIRNAQFYETEHFERLLAEALQQTTEAMTKSISADESLPSILARLQRLIGSNWAALFLLENENLVLMASAGLPQSSGHEDVALPYLAIPLFHEPLSRGQPVVIRDIQTELDRASLPDLGVELRSWIGVPIVVWDVVVGYLAVGNTTPTSYSKHLIGAVQSFAYQAALALEHYQVVSALEVSRSNLSEANLRLANTAQLQVAGEIATSIAHQVNNPLTTIIAESYLLAKYLPPDSKYYESVSAIREAAYRAGTVIQRLVDFSRARPFALAQVDLNQSISSATALLRDQIDPHIARLTLNLAPDLPPVQGSEKHLEDVWLKLLLNARDAIDKPDKGEISMTTSFDKTTDAIQVAIHDNGQGIAADRLDKIFKPFYTTKEKGTGLGLSICKDVIAKHRGSIRVESTLHEGTTVFVTLPVSLRHR